MELGGLGFLVHYILQFSGKGMTQSVNTTTARASAMTKQMHVAISHSSSERAVRFLGLFIRVCPQYLVEQYFIPLCDLGS